MRKILSWFVPLFLLVLSSEAWSLHVAKPHSLRGLSFGLKRYGDYSPIVIKLKDAKKAFMTANANEMTILTLAALNEILNAKYGYHVILHLYETTGKPNARDELGRTAFHHGAKNNWPFLHILAQDKMLDPNERDRKGYTPLMYAIKNGHLAAIWYTMLHPNISVDNFFIEDTEEYRLLQKASRRVKKVFNHSLKVSNNKKEMQKTFDDNVRTLIEEELEVIAKVLRE